MNIEWCKKQKRGIILIEPNEDASLAYYQGAEESMQVLMGLANVDSAMWKATIKYYIEYFAVYAVLMKLGIKSEIHECTITLASWLEEKNILPKGTSSLLEKDKHLRIENQYYLKNKEVNLDFEDISSFLADMHGALVRLTTDDIGIIREMIAEL